MKKIILLLYLLLIVFEINLSAQNAGVTTMGSVCTCPGTFIIPLIVTNSPKPLGALYFDFYWIPSYFMPTLAGLIDDNPSLGPITNWHEYSQFTPSQNRMYLKLYWSTSNSNGQAVTNNINNNTGLLCNLLIYNTGNWGGNTDFDWNYANCEWDDQNSNMYVNTPRVNYYLGGGPSNIIRTINSAPFSITVNDNPVCNGLSTSLTENGGTITTNISWNSNGTINYTNYYWYSGSCGGNLEGTGSIITISPTIGTCYFVRIEGPCGTTTCVSVCVQVVSGNSVAANSATANPNVICPSTETSDLLENGGSLGPVANWNWYSVSCGGILEGSGNTLYSLDPTTETTYWVRAEGTCNTTTCVSVTIIMGYSIAPNNATANPPAICNSNSTNLSVFGGSLGKNAGWYWYTISCGNSMSVFAQGSSTQVTPSINTTYWVRAEGQCNNTTCVSVTVFIGNSSPTSVTASPPGGICSGGSSTLTALGGIIVPNADYYWYSGSCQGSNEGNGSSIVLSPTNTTTYWVNVQGSCNSTTCLSITISVDLLSNNPASCIATPNIFCPNITTTTLSISGGSLGSGANWYWYSVSCGGNNEGTGAPFNPTPTQSTTYWVRAEGTCNTTNCVSTSVTVNTISTILSSITASPPNFCQQSTTTLTENGGNLGTNADWHWYAGTCGGTSSTGNGISIICNPSPGAQEYYARAEGDCNTTNCVSITIIYGNTQPVSINATPSVICSGHSSTLTETGGYIVSDAGSNYYWYSSSCGVAYVESGSSIIVSPTSDMTYWVEAECTCNTTPCVSITVFVNTSTSASSISIQPSVYCYGTSTTLTETGGSLSNGVNWTWYTGTTCGGTIFATGVSIVITPTANETYWVSAGVPCSASSCINTAINISCYQIAGQFTYDNANSTPLDYIDVYLYDQSLLPSNAIHTTTDANGYFVYNTASIINNANYVIAAYTTKDWGGVNTTDATKVSQQVTAQLSNPPYNIFTFNTQFDAADVDNDFNITNIQNPPPNGNSDEYYIMQRFVGSSSSFTIPDWIFEIKNNNSQVSQNNYFNIDPNYLDYVNYNNSNNLIQVNNTNVTQDFKGICAGDVNGSFTPDAKSSAKINIKNENIVKLASNEYYELPIYVTNNITIKGISLVMNFPKELIEIENVQLVNHNDEGKLFYNVIGNEVRIGWISNNDKAITFNKDDALMFLKIKTNSNFKEGDVIKFNVKNNSLSEFADENSEPMKGTDIKTSVIEYSNYIKKEESSVKSYFNIYPNPAFEKLNISYYIANDGNIDISIYNILGEQVKGIETGFSLKGLYNKEVNLSLLQQGVYTIKMKIGDNIIIKKLVIYRK